MNQETLQRILATVGIVAATGAPFVPGKDEIIKNGKLDISDPIPVSSTIDGLKSGNVEIKEKMKIPEKSDIDDFIDINDIVESKYPGDLSDLYGDLAEGIKDMFDESEKRKKDMELEENTFKF